MEEYGDVATSDSLLFPVDFNYSALRHFTHRFHVSEYFGQVVTTGCDAGIISKWAFIELGNFVRL